MARIPHPIPYQGSKRLLAARIAEQFPASVDTLYEPFAGSAAVTLYAAHHRLAKRFVLGDSYEPLVDLWRLIVKHPKSAIASYDEVWAGQREGDRDYYKRIRGKFNETKRPDLLLYLLARCVKNAVRFDRHGNFTQSADKRRLGMRPETLAENVLGASELLRGRTEFFCGDFRDCLRDATTADMIYLDPPYQGTTYGADRRYHKQLDTEILVDGLRSLAGRNLKYALSYDGMSGGREYGPKLPDDVGVRLFLNAGRSSQATLNGRDDVTVESLYLSPSLASGRSASIRAHAQPRLAGKQIELTLNVDQSL